MYQAPNVRNNKPEIPSQTGQIAYYLDHDEVWTYWTAQQQRHSAKVGLRDLLKFLMATANGFDNDVVNFASAWASALSTDSLYDLYTDNARADSEMVLTGIRNVYGFNDTATFALPGFNLHTLAPILAGAHDPIISGGESVFDDFNRRAIARKYIAKLHVAHAFVAAEKNIWPETMDPCGIQHSTLVAGLPKGLQPLAYLPNAGGHLLDAPNWQVLESVSQFKGTRPSTAYCNYAVEGSWEVDDGEVNVNSPSTSFPALDAAVRNTWDHGGRIDMLMNVREFKPVINQNNIAAPLGLAPYSSHMSRHRPCGVIIASAPSAGIDLIGRGVNL
ncbi:hypothetical protein NW768_009956 [Fusarium equiseti]|uniref:Uncharacterized protein n=1 Tax=Fusarium equiseti TaxID=61235 RepID=A0ABQ8R1D2_FUSEQ|nr:hypothetical protein NW768_009956 [Fusarium equiseti]